MVSEVLATQDIQVGFNMEMEEEKEIILKNLGDCVKKVRSYLASLSVYDIKTISSSSLLHFIQNCS